MAGGGKMTGWNVVGDIIKNISPLVVTLLAVTAAVIFIIGFSRHGMNFLKYGFGQSKADELGAKIDGLRTEFKSNLEKMATKEDISMINAKFEIIEVNHFGHLKSYLEMLDGILLDKNIITNKEKAMLDNQLRGM
jgi:hypothetical protein